jgi:hypothetical protein
MTHSPIACPDHIQENDACCIQVIPQNTTALEVEFLNSGAGIKGVSVDYLEPLPVSFTDRFSSRLKFGEGLLQCASKRAASKICETLE